MALKLDGVHTYDPNTGILEAKRHPYVRWAMRGEPPVLWQNKAFWSEGGARIPVEDLPEWVWEKVELMDTAYRHEVLELFTVPERNKRMRDRKKEKDTALSIVPAAEEKKETVQ